MENNNVDFFFASAPIKWWYYLSVSAAAVFLLYVQPSPFAAEPGMELSAGVFILFVVFITNGLILRRYLNAEKQ